MSRKRRGNTSGRGTRGQIIERDEQPPELLHDQRHRSHGDAARGSTRAQLLQHDEYQNPDRHS
jgi:hypothetical protein